MRPFRFRLTFSRNFAGRITSTSRSNRAEMTFKDPNEIPSPYDILDRNFYAIEERSFVNEIRKLNEQVRLDLPALKNLQQLNIPIDSQEKKDNESVAASVEIKYQAFTAFPGLKVPCEESCDPSVHIKVDFSSLNISSSAKDKLRKFFSLSEDADAFEFSVSDFPFITQNRKRALVLLERLIQFSQDESVSINDILGNLNENCDKSATQQKVSGTKKRSQLKFPEEWLHNKASQPN